MVPRQTTFTATWAFLNSSGTNSNGISIPTISRVVVLSLNLSSFSSLASMMNYLGQFHWKAKIVVPSLKPIFPQPWTRFWVSWLIQACRVRHKLLVPQRGHPKFSAHWQPFEITAQKPAHICRYLLVWSDTTITVSAGKPLGIEATQLFIWLLNSFINEHIWEMSFSRPISLCHSFKVAVGFTVALYTLIFAFNNLFSLSLHVICGVKHYA
jgi:hypothetical protein